MAKTERVSTFGARSADEAPPRRATGRAPPKSAASAEPAAHEPTALVPTRPLDVWRCMALFAALAGIAGAMNVQVWACLGFAVAAAAFYVLPPARRPPDQDAGTR